ncbi:VOC family protein [Salana multivorans]
MTTLTLAAIRFTDDLSTMQRFLEAAGLATIGSWGAGMSVLAAGEGQVWLHTAATSDQGAPAGCTQLTGTVDDPDALRERLTAAGYDATIVDEAYARTVEVVDPLGERIVLNDNADSYGSRALPGSPDPATVVSMCRFADPEGPYGAFAEALGLERQGDLNRWYVPYTAGRGTLGVHTTEGAAPLPGAELGGGVSLGLTTTRPLAEIQTRLAEAGFDGGTIVTEEFGSYLETVDPDGQPFLIHAA